MCEVYKSALQALSPSLPLFLSSEESPTGTERAEEEDGGSGAARLAPCLLVSPRGGLVRPAARPESVCLWLMSGPRFLCGIVDLRRGCRAPRRPPPIGPRPRNSPLFRSAPLSIQQLWRGGGGGGRDGRKRDGEGVALTRARMGRESGRTRRRTLTDHTRRRPCRTAPCCCPRPCLFGSLLLRGSDVPTAEGGEKEAALCSRLPAPALDLASRARFRTREGERGCSDFPTRARGRLHSLGRPRMCTARPCSAPHRAVVAATLVTRRRERACVTCFAAFAFAKGTSQSCGLKKSEGMRSK